MQGPKRWEGVAKDEEIGQQKLTYISSNSLEEKCAVCVNRISSKIVVTFLRPNFMQ